MRINLKSAVGGAAALSVAAGLMVVAASNASAAGVPTYETGVTKTLLFYNADGSQKTTGNINDSIFADFIVGNTPFQNAAGPQNKAAMYIATPQDGVAPVSWSTSDLWTSSQLMGRSTSLAGTAFPASIASSAATNPIVEDDSQEPIADHIANTPSTSATDANVFQIRVIQTGIPGIGWVADISVNPANGDWTQVFPAQKTATTLTAPVTNPVSPGAHASSVTVTSTLAAGDGSHPAGTVSLLDNGTAVAGVTPTLTATGAVSATVTAPADGDHNYSFQFTPTDAATYNGVTSAATLFHVNGVAPASATTTVVSASTVGASVSQPVPVTAAVTNSVNAAVKPVGSVQFKLDGSNVGAPVAVDATGVATYSYVPADVAAHTITGAFTPANPANFVASADTTGVTITAAAPVFPVDPQTITTTVPAGTLVISTPYTPLHPFDLGTMVLRADGTAYDSIPANFGDPAAPAATDPGAFTATNTPSTSNGVTITDTRAGSHGWTASAITSDFTDGASHTIDGNGLSFTNVTPKAIAGNALTTANVTTNDITAFKSAPKSFATTLVGPGTINITGKLGLTAPSSTIAGAYTATVTFSIV